MDGDFVNYSLFLWEGIRKFKIMNLRTNTDFEFPILLQKYVTIWNCWFWETETNLVALTDKRRTYYKIRRCLRIPGQEYSLTPEPKTMSPFPSLSFPCPPLPSLFFLLPFLLLLLFLSLLTPLTPSSSSLWIITILSLLVLTDHLSQLLISPASKCHGFIFSIFCL